MQVDLFNKPQLNADPDESPLAYHYATNEEMKDIMALRDAGLTPLVWAVHFVVFEKCRTVAQFCTFQPNEDWGANYVEMLEERQRLLASNIGSA
ncbi:hypothetical protein [Endozoicomonas sp. GU-1]|uniref:hypothetical protein n=1 Tax=Endozoicomonas sp. GU-1 TaxID=3009078 RepID=UPI0022B3ED59|nr:hypothetical protein [Endozoicomonas sp. GU-1]WBA79594.1 hypothetical protein O2T12_14515 [Endozoicomonas sp. GU-1]